MMEVYKDYCFLMLLLKFLLVIILKGRFLFLVFFLL